jgi:hypothetical protein
MKTETLTAFGCARFAISGRIPTISDARMLY